MEEHAGVYVGYRCEGDACGDVLAGLKTVVSQELSLGERVVLSPDPDSSPTRSGSQRGRA